MPPKTTPSRPPCPGDPGDQVTNIAVNPRQSAEDADATHEANVTVTAHNELGEELWFCGALKISLESRSGDVSNFQYSPVASWTAEVNRSSFKDPRARPPAEHEPELHRFYFIIDDNHLRDRTNYRVTVVADVYESGKSFTTTAAFYYQAP